MSGFSPEWLALREPADVAARADGVTSWVAAALASHLSLRIVDLGSGTGSNVRYLASHLHKAQHWRLLDHDITLLSHARTLLDGPVDTQVTDLRELDGRLLDGAHLVTASALLDLVSDPWLARLVGECRRVGAAVLFALNYDGRIVCHPPDPDDPLICTLVNRHQRTDKGFGPALGPESGLRAEALLREAGYEVRVENSDWMLRPAEAELQRQLIAGWATAAMDIEPSEAPRVRDWATRRLALVNHAASTIVVGHNDIGGVRRV